MAFPVCVKRRQVAADVGNRFSSVAPVIYNFYSFNFFLQLVSRGHLLYE